MLVIDENIAVNITCMDKRKGGVALKCIRVGEAHFTDAKEVLGHI